MESPTRAAVTGATAPTIVDAPHQSGVPGLAGALHISVGRRLAPQGAGLELGTASQPPLAPPRTRARWTSSAVTSTSVGCCTAPPTPCLPSLLRRWGAKPRASTNVLHCGAGLPTEIGFTSDRVGRVWTTREDQQTGWVRRKAKARVVSNNRDWRAHEV